MSGLWALVPVKALSRGKSRLAPILGDEERQGLCLAMLRDVLEAISRASGLDGCLVVHVDEAVAEIAAKYGAYSLLEAGDSLDLNAALAEGLAQLRARRATGALIVPADLPLLTTAEISALVAALPDDPGALLCASADGTGTNALLMRPVTLIQPRFGPDSYQAHLAAARAANARVAAISLPGVALDIDEPDDLRRLRAAHGEGHTTRYLHALPV